MDSMQISMQMLIGFVLLLAILILFIVAQWKILKKAGFKGYECLIPFHNLVVMIKIAKKPVYYFFLLLIPIVGIYLMIIILHGISKSFGKGAGFTLGLIFLPFIFYPILGFGKAEYIK